jgi:hypothetical protein
VDRWPSAFRINGAYSSRSSRRCRRNSNRELERACSCPNLILEKQ